MFTTKDKEQKITDYILQLQEFRGATDIRLIEAASMSRFKWREFKQGTRSLTVTELIAIITVLGVSLEDVAQHVEVSTHAA